MNSKRSPVEKIIAVALRVGALASVFFLTLGFVLSLLQGDGSDTITAGSLSVAGNPLPLVLIRLGAALLFLTPFSGVVIAGMLFIRRGEIRFAVLVALLIVILVAGFLTAY